MTQMHIALDRRKRPWSHSEVVWIELKNSAMWSWSQRRRRIRGAVL